MIVKPSAVLFICFDHAVYSPLAAAILRQKAEGKIQAESCGLAPEELNPFVFGIAEESGLNLIPHFSKTPQEFDFGRFDLIVALDPQAAGEARAQAMDLPGTRPDIELWPMPALPTADSSRKDILLGFRNCRDKILERVQTRFAYAMPQY